MFTRLASECSPRYHAPLLASADLSRSPPADTTKTAGPNCRFCSTRPRPSPRGRNAGRKPRCWPTASPSRCASSTCTRTTPLAHSPSSGDISRSLRSSVAGGGSERRRLSFGVGSRDSQSLALVRSRLVSRAQTDSNQSCADTGSSLSCSSSDSLPDWSSLYRPRLELRLRTISLRPTCSTHR